MIKILHLFFLLLLTPVLSFDGEEAANVSTARKKRVYSGDAGAPPRKKKKKVEFVATDVAEDEIVVALDTETTGLSFKEDRVLSFAGIKLKGDQPTGEELSLFFKAPKKSHPMAFKAHGLTDEFLSDKPPFADKAQEIRDFIGGHRIVAHNANFDWSMLNAEFSRAEVDPLKEEQKICTKKIAQAKLEKEEVGGFSLDKLCAHFKVEDLRKGGFHGALIDTKMLIGLFQNLRKLPVK